MKAIITELAKMPNLTPNQIDKVLKTNSKSTVLAQFIELEAEIGLSSSQTENFLNNIKMKQVRTNSGVTTVTVLTKPFPCPGKCIFCPSDVRMPKSYISSEPGAQRAGANLFDPYLQTFNRLLAIKNIGHPTDKVELIILGGTWTSYPKEYQIWFIKRCFDALNDFDPTKKIIPYLKSHAKERQVKEILNAGGSINYNLSVSLDGISRESAKWYQLINVQKINETAKSRCVGLVIETRPDEITKKEVTHIRKLGATKVQIGVQSLNDTVLELNKRGHTSDQTAKAFKLLRKAGFKIHAHYMPNLYGSTPQKDISDFAKMFNDIRFRPDELKIYPCSLIVGTELMEIYNQKKWRPYTTPELLKVLTSIMIKVPRYCRVTRMIRDIPSQEIVDGNKITNFRQKVDEYLQSKGIALQEIRSREIRQNYTTLDQLKLKITKYKTASSSELFLEYITLQNKIAGFLRLSLPESNTAMIREVHVYGASLVIGDSTRGAAQHLGLGTKLIQKAKDLAIKNGYKNLAVISSVGTRKYYEKFGFKAKGLYQQIRLGKNV